jgi:hypothetical protein
MAQAKESLGGSAACNRDEVSRDMRKHKANALPRQRTLVMAVWLLCAGVGLSQPEQAEAASRKAAKTQNPVPVAAESSGGSVVATRSHVLTLKDMGVLRAILLRGVEGSAVLPFNVRTDEVVVAAKLKLNYTYSPALIERISHIKVMLNEEVIYTIPVPREQAGIRLTREIQLPAKVMAEYNKLTLQLIGHYTLDCEDPVHTSLWASIANDTELELSVVPTVMANNLANLPRPFFDSKDNRALDLPFVITGANQPGVLESAGIVASWFGALADYRGARFPTTDGQLPAKGNAVVFLQGGARLEGVELPAVSGPTLAMTAHPGDPLGKLLLVMGRDAAELKQAATALAMGANGLSGPVAQITRIENLKSRKLYDAPRWLPTDRAVKFGEITDPQTLTVNGYFPDVIRVNMRVVPDLFTWRNKDVPVDLKFRYTQPPRLDKSTLNVDVNNDFLRMMPLRAKTHEEPGRFMGMLNRITPSWFDFKMPDEEKFGLPLYKMQMQTQMQFRYFHDVLKEGACKDVVLDNMRGTVEPESTIDVSSFAHFKAMPDIAAFANMGYPFTRMADLSETAVVLPEGKSLNEIQAYLNVMGRMGASTGLPATGVTVSLGGAADGLSGKDLLVIGTTKNQPLLGQWSDAMPAKLDGPAKDYRFSDILYRFFNWWRDPIKGRELVDRTQVVFNSNSTDAAIVGFESPLNSGRSVVLLASNNSAGVDQSIDAMHNPDLLPKLQGALAVIRDKQVQSVAANETYTIGNVNPLVYVYWKLSRGPWWLIVFSLIAAGIVAAAMYFVLRARSRARLKPKS